MLKDMDPKIAKAIAFAAAAHEGQKRPGGESQYDHCMRVGEIASRFAECYQQDDVSVDLRISAEEAIDLIVAAVLHDVLEDTAVTDVQLVEQFGERPARIVRAVSHEDEEEPDEVYLHRVLAGGRLSVIVKRSDRLDNLSTLRYAPHEFRQRKLMEVRASLPLWYEIDPEGAPLIEDLLVEVENASTIS